MARTAGQHLGEARATYAAAVTAWAAATQELGCGEPVLATLPAPPDVPDDVVAAVHSLTTSVREARAVERAGREIERADLEARVAVLTEERAGLTAGVTAEPAPPPWRSPHARAGRAGAPLWRVIDVVAGTSAGLLDRVEGALAAAGLLDAWVTPGGAVEIDGETADALVEVDEGWPVAGAGAATLATILRPAELDEPPVPPAVVARLLDAVALVDDATVSGSPGAETPGARTSPAIASAAISSMLSSMLSPRMATRSPLRRPSPSSAVASRHARS